MLTLNYNQAETEDVALTVSVGSSLVTVWVTVQTVFVVIVVMNGASVHPTQSVRGGVGNSWRKVSTHSP